MPGSQRYYNNAVYGQVTQPIPKHDKVPVWTSCRYRLAYVGFFCFMVVYWVRLNLSIAIVCMSAPPNVTSDVNGNKSASAVCQFDDDASNQTLKLGTAGQFPWSKSMQGNILGAFFFGYVATQIPGGILAQRFGTKIVMMCSLCLSFLCTVLVPVAASFRPETVGPYLLIFLRVVLGLATGVCFPAMHAMWGKWAPPYENTRLTTITYSGATLGGLITYPLSGYLCVDGFAGGWPSVFYVPAIINVVAIGMWWFLVNETPSVDPRITDIERKYIIASIGDKVGGKRTASAPWRSILTSRPVLAIIGVHFATGWGFYTILISMPSYMKEVLKYDIKSNGVLSALPNLAFSIIGVFAGVTADLMRTRTSRSTTFVRRLYQGVANVGATVLAICVVFVTCDNRAVGVVCLTMSCGFLAFARAGYLVNHVDLAPRYSGVLFGLTNTVANLSGVLVPFVNNALTPNGTREEWQSVFYVMAAILIAGASGYVVFARGEKQKWAMDEDNKNVVDEIIVSCDNEI